MARRKLVAGNWKMNTTQSEARSLASAIVQGVGGSPKADVAVFPPFVWLAAVGDLVRGTAVSLGAQNVYSETKGAFTGETSPAMLLEAGCKSTLIGHSERRQILGESDAAINQKVHAALDAGLQVVLCMGETRPEREKEGLKERVFQRQIFAGLAGVTGKQMSNVVIAYEPVWAIGTGLTATPEQAQESHKFIRGKLTQLYGEAIGAATIILYGGSVTPETAAGLFSQPDVDGGLVGGASLKADAFLKIIAAAGV